MTFNFNIFASTLLFSGTAAFFLGLFVLLRLGGSFKWFAALILCISVWSLGYSLELASSTLEQMMILVNVQYIGIALLPACWLVFTLQFSNLRRWLSPINLVFIFIFPITAIVMVATNEYHHLHYESVYLDTTSGPFPLLGIKSGLWYQVHTVYFYFSLILGNIFLIRNHFAAKRQTRAIVIASLIPWVFNILYLLGMKPYGHIDLTPYAFILTSATIAYSILKHNLFTIVPVAHEKIIRSIHQGILIIDKQDNIVDINRAMSSFIGIESSRIIGERMETVLADRKKWIDWIRNSTESKQDILVNDKHYEITHIKLRDKNKSETGMIFTAQDITERKKAEADLIALNLLKDKLFSIIAHDLRSPFATLIEILNLLKTGNLTDDEFKNFVPMISENVEYTGGLLENLLQWSKSHIKGESINPQSFDAYELIESKVKMFRKSATDKSITLVNETKPGLFVFADKDMVSLILRNLVSNAVKFCNTNDRISIVSSVDEHFTTISVIDTGVGMSKESLEKLFKADVFSTRGTHNEYGTGLGLMLCKEFAEKNGGSLFVESELGKGSTFSFTLKSN